MGLGSNGDDDDGYVYEYLSKMSHPSLSQSLSLAQSPEQQQQRHRQEEKKEKIAAPDSVMTAAAPRLLV